MRKSFPSEIPFAALLVYSPHGKSAGSERSRRLVRDPIKRGDRKTLELAAKRAGEVFEAAGFAEFLGAGVVLVPVPRSSPTKQGYLWPAHRICEELVKRGLGARVLPCLRRKVEVPKLAVADSKERNVEKHLSTLVVEPALEAAKRIALVDDVVTTGSTLYASVRLVSEAFPDAMVRAFALARSMGPAELEKFLQACRGVIRYNEATKMTTREP